MSDFISEFIQKKRLGMLLVEKGLVSEKDVLEALKEQEETREFLGEILIRKGLINDEIFYKVLAEQLKLRYYTLDEAIKILEKVQEEEFQGIVSKKLCRENNIFLLSYLNGVLEVLTSDPLNLTLKDQISLLCKCEVVFSVTTKNNIKKIKEYLSKKMQEVGKILIEEALRSPVDIVAQLCEKCDETMIFVLKDIALKHNEPLARKKAIERLGNFKVPAVLFVLKQIAKKEKNPENLKIVNMLINDFR